MSETRTTRLTKALAYVGSYLKDPRVAALAPSSPQLIARLMRHLEKVEPRLAIELGPGDGVATRAVLALLPSDGRLIAIERNPEFCAELKKWEDGRLQLIEGDARQFGQLISTEAGIVDAVIVSIPCTYLSPAEREAMAKDAYRLLRPGGAFVVFHQYSPLMGKVIRAVFGEVETERETHNVMPAYVMVGMKVRQ